MRTPLRQRCASRTPVFGGKAHGLFALNGAVPQVVTIGQRVFEAAVPGENHPGERPSIPAHIDPSGFKTSVLERVQDSEEGMRLADAAVIVSGGRGIGSAEDFARLEDLAAVLEGAMGA
jgi:electron transfer flavoprotein alpha subunit